MKTFYSILTIALFLLLGNHQVIAQTYTFNQGSSFSPAWVAGASSGSASNIGGSGINCTVNMAFTGSGAFSSPYPRVNVGNATAADFEVQGSTDAMEIDIDLANRASYLTVTYTFSKPVQNLVFSISDIDRPNGSSPFAYVDQVTVSGTGATGTVVPSLSKYNSSSAIFGMASNVATGTTGTGGANVSSTSQGSPSQDGTMVVDFDGNTITSFTIQYGTLNSAAVNSNPSVQAIAIGNMNFEKAIAPVTTNTSSSSIPNKNAATVIGTLTGSDDESVASFTIATLPSATAGTLYYYNGTTNIAITAGQVLTPAQAAALRFDPLPTYTGNTSFTFTATDNRGLVSNSSTYTIPVLSSTLPVTIISFSAGWNNNAVVLAWTTAQEFNSEKFIVEKSNNGSDWVVMATVAAAGNSNSTKNYTATDAQPVAANFYRLKEVDVTGVNTYSRVIRMSKDEKINTALKIYPNPVTTTVTVSAMSAKSQPVQLKVYSTSGLLVKEMAVQLNQGTNNINIPSVNTFANGFYVVSVEDVNNNRIGGAQFVKQ